MVQVVAVHMECPEKHKLAQKFLEILSTKKAQLTEYIKLTQYI